MLFFLEALIAPLAGKLIDKAFGGDKKSSADSVPSYEQFKDPYAEASASIAQFLDLASLAKQFQNQGKYINFDDAGIPISISDGTPGETSNEYTKNIYNSAFQLTKPYQMLQYDEIPLTSNERYLQNFFGTLMEAPSESNPLPTIPKGMDEQVQNAIGNYLQGSGLPQNVIDAMRSSAMSKLAKDFRQSKNMFDEEANKRGYGASNVYTSGANELYEGKGRNVADLEANILKTIFDSILQQKTTGIQAGLQYQNQNAQNTLQQNQQELERSRIDRTLGLQQKQLASAILADLAKTERIDKEAVRQGKAQEYATKTQLDRQDALMALENLSKARFQTTGYNSNAYNTAVQGSLGQQKINADANQSFGSGIAGIFQNLGGTSGGINPAPATSSFGSLGNSLSSSINNTSSSSGWGRFV